MRFVLTRWTDSASVVAAADSAGIDRVVIDLERIGSASASAAGDMSRSEEAAGGAAAKYWSDGGRSHVCCLED
jgi:hypothetical protein